MYYSCTLASTSALYTPHLHYIHLILIIHTYPNVHCRQCTTTYDPPPHLGPVFLSLAAIVAEGEVELSQQVPVLGMRIQ